MTAMSNKVVKGFLGTVILLSGLLSFTQIAKAQMPGTTTDPANSPWTNGSISINPSSVPTFSDGVRAVFTVQVTPPVRDVNNNETIDDTAPELNSWMSIDGKAGTLNANGDRINSQGFAIQIATDATFSTASTVVNHPFDVKTTDVSSVVDVRIGPPTDDPLDAATTYNFRIIGYSPGRTETHVLYGRTITTQAAGANIAPIAAGANTSGNTIVGNGANLTADDLDPNTGLPACGVMSTAKVFGCIGQIMYYIVFVPTSWVMVLAGEIMDFGIGYSISSSSYPVTGHSFVTDGWRIMRDIANIFFIFILIYVAISTILGQDKKKLIGWVILVALIINFSLFLTKVVVDFGNITARFFYNNISVTNPQTATTITGSAGHKSISYGFASTFNPAKLLANAKQSTTVNSAGGVIATGMSDEQFAGFYTVFALVGGVVNLVAAFVFFSMAWLFIARTIGIWLSMIFAPLAFLSLTLPDKWDLGGAAGGGAGKYMKFGSWWSNLTSLAVMPAVAMLMIFLILTFLKTNFLGNIPNETTTGQFIGVLLPLIMVSYLLLQTKKTAESMAGDFGGMMSKAGNFVGGAALGLATGGTALLARKTIGAGAMKLAESEKFKNYASKSRIGQKLWQGTKSISNSSFDARNVKIMGKDLASTGLGVGKVKSEGYIKDAQKKAKEQKKTADTFDASEKERENQKHLENEHLRKEFLMKRGEKDPYTGEVPTQTEVDEAKNIADAEKKRIESVYLKRRENYAQRVEQGDGLGYLVNKVTRKKPTDEMRQSLTDAQNELGTLQTAGIGGLDANGKTITQQTLDDAQKKVTGAKQKMTQAETGWVGAHDNSTAQAIRSSKKMKKTVDKDDPNSWVEALKESQKEETDKLREELSGKKKESSDEGKKKDGDGEGKTKESKSTQNQPAEEVPVAPGNYTQTSVGFKPQPKAQAQQSNQPTVNAPIGFRPQANANFTGGNYGRNNVKQPANQYGNLGGVDDNRKQNTGPQINSTAPINISNSKININTTGGLAANGNNSQGSYSRSEVGFNRENNQSENRRIGFQFGGNTANEKAEVASKIGKEAPITNTTTSAQTPTERKPIEGLFGNREAAQSKTPEERANRFEQKTFERRPLQTARPAPKPAPAASTTETSTEPEPKRNVVKGFFGGKDE
jgi:hypothetical protein